MYGCVVCPVEAIRQQESPIYLDEQIKHFFYGLTRSMEAYCNTPSSFSQSFDCRRASKTLATFTIHGVCAGREIMEDGMHIYVCIFFGGGGRATAYQIIRDHKPWYWCLRNKLSANLPNEVRTLSACVYKSDIICYRSNTVSVLELVDTTNKPSLYMLSGSCGLRLDATRVKVQLWQWRLTPN